ncbi:hypothetical protein VFPPC_14940 [Pochonia chlamydosporia 170]|uniref:Uncharacterized protein n=1 Tax=Pochonia chlamydosporia 170 TaxID=1380566 RepID=A0A179FUD6_METCM|nr:hypothetical protein VFPPC_14940 [Pochonia chlamydosporia 170]OAQ69276.1 hypothetical protein VFPPC_14940 [Pochonia chlamydosporia 170]
MYSESDFTLPFEQVLDCGPASMAPEAPMSTSFTVPSSEKHVLQSVLYRLESLEKEVGKSNRLEKRFDAVDRELLKNSKLEGIERDITRLRESINSLAKDLKSFSVEMSTRPQEGHYHAE